MNRFHGIQQNCGIVRTESSQMSYGSSSSDDSYEGDADNDSFTTCSPNRKKKSDIPNFSPSSTSTRTLKYRNKSSKSHMPPCSSLAYSSGTKDICYDSDCTSFTQPVESFDDTVLSTLVESPKHAVTILVDDLDRSNNPGSYFKDISTSEVHVVGTSIDSTFQEIERNDDTFAAKKGSKAISGHSSVVSTSSHTKTTVGTHSSTSSSSSSPIASPPRIRNPQGSELQIFTHSMTSSMTGVASSLPSFVSTSSSTSFPSPIYSSVDNRGSERLGNSFRPVKIDGDSSISSISRSERVQAMKSRLRSMEAGCKLNSSRSLLQANASASQNPILVLPKNEQSLHAERSLRLAREVMAVTFTAFLVCIAYLHDRDAQSNALQFQVSRNEFLERSLALATDMQLQSLKFQKEIAEVLDHTLATVQEQKDLLALAGSTENYEQRHPDLPNPFDLPTYDIDSYIEPMESHIQLHSLVPTPSAVHEEDYMRDFAPTLSSKLLSSDVQQQQEAIPKRPKKLKVPMFDFFIVQSLMD